MCLTCLPGRTKRRDQKGQITYTSVISPHLSFPVQLYCCSGLDRKHRQNNFSNSALEGLFVTIANSALAENPGDFGSESSVGYNA